VSFLYFMLIRSYMFRPVLGHPQEDSQVVHYITAVGGCPIVAGFLVVHTRNLCVCVCVYVCARACVFLDGWGQMAQKGPKHVGVN
jgi:hypothetical protein